MCQRKPPSAAVLSRYAGRSSRAIMRRTESRPPLSSEDGERRRSVVDGPSPICFGVRFQTSGAYTGATPVTASFDDLVLTNIGGPPCYRLSRQTSAQTSWRLVLRLQGLRFAEGLVRG
jgi:hypothetical protein